jgi:hypothetical protein
MIDAERTIMKSCFSGGLMIYNQFHTPNPIVSMTLEKTAFIADTIRLVLNAPPVPKQIVLNRFVTIRNKIDMIGPSAGEFPPKVGTLLPHMLPFATTLRGGFAMYWGDKMQTPCCLLRIIVPEGTNAYFWGPTPDDAEDARKRMEVLMEKPSYYEVLMAPYTLRVVKVETKSIDATRKYVPEFFAKVPHFDPKIRDIPIYTCELVPIKLQMVFCKTTGIAKNIIGNAEKVFGEVLMIAPDLLSSAAINIRLSAAVSAREAIIVPITNDGLDASLLDGFDIGKKVAGVTGSAYRLPAGQVPEDVLAEQKDAINYLLEILDDIKSYNDNEDDYITTLMGVFYDVGLDKWISKMDALFTKSLPKLDRYERNDTHYIAIFNEFPENVRNILEAAKQYLDMPRETKLQLARRGVQTNNHIPLADKDDIEKLKVAFIRNYSTILEPFCTNRVGGISVVPFDGRSVVLGKENDGVYKGQYNFFGGKISDKVGGSDTPSAKEVCGVLFEEIYEEMGILIDATELKASTWKILKVPYTVANVEYVSVMIVVNLTDLTLVWKAIMACRRLDTQHKFYEMTDIGSFYVIGLGRMSAKREISAYVRSALPAIKELMLLPQAPPALSIYSMPTVRINESGQPSVVRGGRKVRKGVRKA